ncbi:MAG: patatin-like phospholipase family protein [Pseudomonadota bacterium]
MHRVYVAFEGGGARGLAHIGALKALQEAEAEGKIEICGYAGTSAGAVVASLAAAGFDWDELADPDRKRHILKVLFERPGTRLPGDTPVALLGANGWRWIDAVRRLINASDRLKPSSDWIPYAPWAVAVALILAQFGWMALLMVPLIGVAVLALVGVAAIWLYQLPGLANLDNLERVLNEAFDLALDREPSDPRAATFADMEGTRKTPSGHLRKRMIPTVVTTDFSNGTLRYFPSREADLNETLASVVTASACIPLVFQPRTLRLVGSKRPALFYDGGLTSNLPAWAFDDRLRLEEHASVIAIAIKDGSGQGRSLGTLFRTAIFGSALLNDRNIPQLHRVDLDTDQPHAKIGTLDFDMSWNAMRGVMALAEEDTKREVLTPLTEWPEVMGDFLDEARSIFAEGINVARQQRGFAPSYDATSIRAALLRPFGAPTAGVRVRYALGYDSHADDRVSLPLDNSVCGKAFQSPDGFAVYKPKLAGGRRRRQHTAETDLKKPKYRLVRWRTDTVKMRFICAFRLRFPFAELEAEPDWVMQLDGNVATALGEDDLDELCYALIGVMQALLDKVANPGT